jgi:hypothetical protein
MNEQEMQIKNVEISIDSAKEAIKMADALNRLHKNKDFKRVILEGYLREHPAQLAILSADPEMATPDRQAHVSRLFTGIGALAKYFDQIFTTGDRMEYEIEQAEATLDELRGSDAV